MRKRNLNEFLDSKVREYNQPGFISSDPISIPHLFSNKQDIEIAGFFAAIFSWGNRTIIIKKSKELMTLMDMAPFDFIQNHTTADLKKLQHFKHRTFNSHDLFYCIEFFHHHYAQHDSLEQAIFPTKNISVEEGLNHFKTYFFSLEHEKRTKKHVSSPQQKSTCKRLNMFLRWMVRSDNTGVDFGIWKNISPTDLICPVDLHVARVARRFGLLHREQTDWQAAVELTTSLKQLDKNDPVKYDFALFALGAIEKYG